MDEKPIDSKQFAQSFQGFMETMRSQTPAEPPFRRRLREHLGSELESVPVHSQAFDRYDHPNLHSAIERILSGDGVEHELVGVRSRFKPVGIGLADLTSTSMNDAVEAPPEFTSVSLGKGMQACLQSGLYLVRKGPVRSVLFVQGQTDPYRRRGAIVVEVASPSPKVAEEMLGRIRTEVRERNVYRGQVLSLEQSSPIEPLVIRFHRLPSTERRSIVLPDGVLERIERQTDGASRHRDALLESGRHLKRGLLLHGPPGTGKTLTAMYVAQRMPGRTVFLLTGRALALLGQTFALARMLEPSLVILEDVDLIAEERTRANSCGALLFELLNEMDGLAPDVDVVTLLTTNRPELLEPALASRPGRVDLAIEIPLPDDEGRAKLLDLYSEGLAVELEHRSKLIRQSRGVSGAFIRELLRKAKVIAADAGQAVVRDPHVREALHELTVAGGELTRSILGMSADSPGDD